MHVVILSPMVRILDHNEIAKVRVKLEDGSWLSVYEKHAPVIAAVAPCEVELADALGQRSRVKIGEGVLQLRGNTLTIYVKQSPSEVTEGEGQQSMHLEVIDRLSAQLLELLGQQDLPE